MMRILALFILLFFVLSHNAGAFQEPPLIEVSKPTPVKTVTVCTTGCNYNTLEEADQVAQPGWLIRVKTGTYSSMTWNSSGTAGNEIVVEAYGDGNAIFNCVGSTVFSITGSYIIFDGGPDRELIFDGSGMAEKSVVIRPSDGSGSNHVTLSRIVVRNAFGTNVQPTGDYFKLLNSEVYGASGVAIYGRHGDYHEIRNNVIHDNAWTGIQYNPHEDSAVVHSCDELTIAGNVIYNNGFNSVDIRPGIALLSSKNRLYDVYVYNNLIWGNKKAGITGGDNSNSNIRLYHNTIYKNVDAGLSIGDTATWDVRNNIVFDNGNNDNDNWHPWSSNFKPSDGTNNLLADPQFESIDAQSIYYLKLSSSSTDAIDQGFDLLGVIDDDYSGNSRPFPPGGKYDIGAHEYSEGAPPLTGDLNGDGDVNIQDIQACVNDILGLQDWGSSADVNEDGNVNVLDVQAIGNIILTRSDFKTRSNAR